MNTYNVFIGDKEIMSDVQETDLKHKLEFLRAYFTHYPDDELLKEEIKVVKNENCQKSVAKLRYFRRRTGKRALRSPLSPHREVRTRLRQATMDDN